MRTLKSFLVYCVLALGLFTRGKADVPFYIEGQGRISSYYIDATGDWWDSVSVAGVYLSLYSGTINASIGNIHFVQGSGWFGDVRWAWGSGLQPNVFLGADLNAVVPVSCTSWYSEYVGRQQLTPLTFNFSNLTFDYNGTVKTATVTPSIVGATFTADLSRGPAAGSYTVTATAVGDYTGSGSATLVINPPPPPPPPVTAEYDVSYEYNDRGELSAIRSPDGNAVATFTYSVDGRRASRWLANNTQTDYGYDDAGRMTSLRQYRRPEETNIEQQTYGYDLRDRRTYTQRNGDRGDTYGYQADGQLIDYKHNAANPTSTPTDWARAVAYAYDAVGNRLSVNDNGTAIAYGVNHANQYSSITGANIQYSDGRGNVTVWNEWSYSYDAENRLTSATKSGLTVNFAYDAAGRQVKRTTNGVSEYLIYTGAQQIERVDVNDTILESTIWGPGADEAIAGYKTGMGVFYYHGDIQGSTVAITDSNRSVLEFYRYDPYGNTTCYDSNMGVRAASAYNIRFLYTGQEYLSALGLYNYKARFYSTAIGRFLQIDPIGLSAGDINLYRYCGNGPCNGSDPSGLEDPAHNATDNSFPDFDSIKAGIGHEQNTIGGMPSSSPAAPNNEVAGSEAGRYAPTRPGTAAANEIRGSSLGRGASGVLGKIWNLPNTAVGLVWGALGFVAEAVMYPFTGTWDYKVSFANNAIQFENHPFLAPRFMPAGLTLGNTISYSSGYGPNADPAGARHETQHTYQGQITGPLYFPLHILGKAAGLLINGNTEGRANFMEKGPYSSPPRPWPWK